MKYYILNYLSKKLSSKLAKEVIWSVLLKIMNTIFMPLSIIILARVLGANEFGIYTYALSIISILSVPTSLGLPTVVTKFSANYYEAVNWSKLKGLFFFTNVIVLILGIIIIALTIITIKFDFFGLANEKKIAIYLLSPLVLILGLEGLRSAALKGIDEIIWGQIPVFLIRPVLFLSLILISHYFFELNYYITCILYLFSIGISYLVGTFKLLVKTKIYFRNRRRTYETIKWIRSGFPLLIIGSVQVLGGNIDIIILGYFTDNSQIGIYKAISQLGILVIFGLTAINNVTTPKYATLHLQGKIQELQLLVSRANWIVLILALPFFLISIFYGEFILGLLFGNEFKTGYMALTILVGGRIINAFLGSSSSLLKMTGFEKEAAYGIIAGTILNIIFNLILIPIYGIEGAAIASFIGLATWNIILSIIVKKKLKINMFKFPTNG